VILAPDVGASTFRRTFFDEKEELVAGKEERNSWQKLFQHMTGDKK
jgi:hypothetical protein